MSASATSDAAGRCEEDSACTWWPPPAPAKSIGVDTFRLNFSHGTQDDHARVHAAIRALEKEVGRPIAILQDLQGPKIRFGTICDGKITVAASDKTAPHAIAA